jgi:hypothetical protein
MVGDLDKFSDVPATSASSGVVRRGARMPLRGLPGDLQN